jgi:CRISPR-associated endoribonuclease Cas6
MTTELIRCEFPARWENGAPEGGYPGRAVNAWLYGAIARIDAAAATELHGRDAPKPVTVALATMREELRLVVTGCGAYAPLIQRVCDQVPSRILLNGRWLCIRDAETKTERWAALAGQWLLIPERTPGARITFLTPTTFRSGGRSMPLPTPTPMFRGLLERWQAWASVDLGADAARVLDDHVAIARHALVSEWVRFEGLYATFRGWADFRLVRPPHEYRGLLALLAAFAEYAGVGQKTTMGLGCVRARIHEPPPRSAAAAVPVAGSAEAGHCA